MGAAPPPASRVLEDIMELERDFRYNLNLLKLRDQEIQKCNIAYKNVEEKLAVTVEENCYLSNKCDDLQKHIHSLEQDRQKEKDMYEETLKKLKANTTRMMQNEEKYISFLEGEKMKNKELETRLSKMKQAEIRYKELISKSEQENNNKISTILCLEAKYSSVVDENAWLKNKILEMESKSTSEMSVYKSEIDTSVRQVSTLQKELEICRQQYDDFTKTKLKLVKENNDLTVELIRYKNLTESLETENKSIKTELAASRIKMESLQDNCSKLLDEIETLKSNSPPRDQKEFDTLLKQNKILQEIIKTSRKSANLEDGKKTETEENIERLEMSVNKLKKILIANLRNRHDLSE